MDHAAVVVPHDAEIVTAVVLPLPRVANVSIGIPPDAQPVAVAVPPLPLVPYGSIIPSAYAEAVWASVSHFASVTTHTLEVPAQQRRGQTALTRVHMCGCTSAT
eukprot:GHVU01078938.1.p3 GENE.GHVU01078938.1~~GHVU01078938.1.p3  ORF type:complete len:104 (+),score=1.31 GHVU01078938.1:239-550(+)